MTEVRASVDALDRKIVNLLATRFLFMEAAARIKQSRQEIRDEDRKAQVLTNVRFIASGAGAPPDAIAAVYDRLIESSIAYELDRFDGG